MESLVSKKTILVVDDSFVNRLVLTKILSSQDYNVLQAENGKVALNTLYQNKDKIDLMLLDLIMPVMDGFSVLREMKNANLFSRTPVIITSVCIKKESEILALELGASDFIRKPYNKEIVLHRIMSILRLYNYSKVIHELEFDELTGLYSRLAFYNKAEKLIKENPDTKYQIVFTNIENFKVINAKYGSDKGDELLKYLANTLKSNIKKDEICGRLGSDNFLLLVKRGRQYTQEEVSKTNKELLASSPIPNIIIKYGVYNIDSYSDNSISQICDKANIALSAIKYRYGLYYSIYTDSLNTDILRKEQIMNSVEESLDNNRFIVYLQPKHDTLTGEISGAEALVRWNHPEFGNISPDEFIPLFEQNGFIVRIDKFVWEETFKLIKKWTDEKRKLIPISINISRMDFFLDDVPSIILKLAEKYTIPHEYIHLEITESAYTEDTKRIIAEVNELRKHGFIIEMDDFGSGYSSLNMLSELPIDILKLDINFIQNSNKQNIENKLNILRFVIDLSKWLHYSTTAEGVETKEELNLLRTMGCTNIQGFYFSKPMTINEFETFELNYKNERKHNKIIKQAKPHILIIEDVELNRKILYEILKKQYKISTVSNGIEAYKFLKKNNKIACLLLDLAMPEMNGFELLQLLKKENMLDYLPVIITSETGKDNEFKAIHLGAIGSVSKPYNPEELLHNIKLAIDENILKIKKLQNEC